MFDFEAAAKLPENIRFGTSSWTYPGWQGMVYHHHYKDEKELRSNCLSEYAKFAWFRTLGIDSTFYAPPKPETLSRYASQLSESFQWVSKVWEEITIPEYPGHPRYGKKAGQKNPDFLNADKFLEHVLRPYEISGTLANTGPFVFQFQSMSQTAAKDPAEFLAKLDAFLGLLPQTQRYAVEIRDRSLLIPAYFKLLNKHGATHCFNHWSYMPALKVQMQKAAEAGGLEAPFFVARILTPLGFSYNKAVEEFKPYNVLKAPIPQMRADVVRFAKRTLEKNVTAFILVNNRAEGNAPGTIDAIGKMIINTLC